MRPLHTTRVKPYYIQFLRDELARRKSKNPRYSLRAFATYLLLDPSALSRIFSGKQELSLQAAVRMMKKIRCTEEQRIRFLTSLSKDKMRRAATILAKSLSLPATAFASVVGDGEEAEKFRTLLDALPHLAWIVTVEGQIEYCNRSFREFVGTTCAFPDEWSEIIHPEDYGDVLKEWNEAASCARAFEREFRIRGQGGEYYLHHARAVPCKDDLGRLVRWSCVGSRKQRV